MTVCAVLHPSNVFEHCACAVGSSIQFDGLKNKVKAVFTRLCHLYVVGALTATVLLRTPPTVPPVAAGLGKAYCSHIYGY